MKNSLTHSSWAEVSAFIPTGEANVWQLLTDPKFTERYMYQCQLHADWHIGGKAVWKAQNENGDWVEHVKAQVLIYNPSTHLAFTIFHEATDDYPEVQSELHYHLEPQKNGVKLTIRQGDFAQLGLENTLRQRCQQGWEYVMPLLKETAGLAFEKPK
jgi:uncharacterized protein YndB with AHSA1/START domain